MSSRLIFLFIVGVGTTALAQGVGGSGPRETTHTIEGMYQAPLAPKTWETQIGSPNDRIGVELDPSGPTWRMRLERHWPGNSVEPQHFIRVCEHLTISGQRSWTGWTQRIDAPGFEWRLTGPYVEPATILADGAVPSGLDIQVDGSVLRFTFDPLPPGTQIDIISGLRYGDWLLPESFDVQQFPVPEPAALACIGVGGVILAGRRRLRTACPLVLHG
ncbi:MAG TPA: PEP-CTERM sorting domain-containing protein [Phycisphaerae bacterium]|nr:PEP-CTERM sorting domain-containing protein [Phycisphaerae bacterium]HOL26839.1 PEP-CTERM sorting domain-containing protein [Phycisphaerae bacterium]